MLLEFLNIKKNRDPWKYPSNISPPTFNKSWSIYVQRRWITSTWLNQSCIFVKWWHDTCQSLTIEKVIKWIMRLQCQPWTKSPSFFGLNNLYYERKTYATKITKLVIKISYGKIKNCSYIILLTSQNLVMKL